MNIEETKNCLAVYDETYSWDELSELTGRPIEELRDLYDEIFSRHEIQTRRKAMQRMNAMKGVYRIEPITLNVKHYSSLEELKADGYTVSNVFYSCRHPESLCKGYMWRFGVTVDDSDVKGSIIKANPRLFKALVAKDIRTGVSTHYPSIQVAHSLGFDKKGVSKALDGRIRSYKGYIWEYAEE